MPVKKRYISNGEVCKVTFILPEEIEADTAFLVGGFNDWDKKATPMTQLKSGQWKIDLNLAAQGEFEYRYLVNGNEWHNDWEADKYVPNRYGVDNSVVIT